MEVSRLFVACLLVIVVSAQLPSQDILALLEFKKGITLDPTGYILDSWNEESIDFNGCPSSWNGIVCSGGNVAGVILDNMDLVADADLGVFTNLTMLFKLSMANNSISGVIKKNVVGFKSLKYLDISNNLFSGALPEEIGRIASLQNLSIAGNNLTGSLPKFSGGFTSLISLDLSHNSLSGRLPPALTTLKSLILLNLSFNRFVRRIPTGFEKLSNLKVLDLSWNRLNGGIDWTFIMQSNVVHVDLSGNFLVSLSTKELKFLSDISDTVKYLNLSNNQLTGSLIDGGTLSTFRSLKVLDLSYNQLSGELPGFNYVYDLEVLKLGNNQFSGFLPDGLLKTDSLVLTDLDLSSNNLSGRINMITSPTLKNLNLSSNSISGNLPLIIGSCRILDLSQNQFAGNLSVLEKWSSEIVFIDLSQNCFTGSFPQKTSEFLRLNHLNISHNSLNGSLPPVLASYQTLTVLDLSSNHFDGSIPNELLINPTLEELHLRDNLLSGGVILSTSPRKSNLRVLDISKNRFDGGFPDDLSPFGVLQILNVAENNLSGHLLASSLSELISLISLDISYNDFTGNLPGNFSTMTLKKFNVSYNDLSGIVPPNFRNFPDSSFHPGNSRLVLPNSPSNHHRGALTGQSVKKPIKTFVKVIVIITCVFAVFVLILLAIILHYKRISRQPLSECGMRNNGGKKSNLSNSCGAKGRQKSDTLVLSADKLISMAAPRKGPYDQVTLQEKKLAASGFSPSKTSRFSWSPDSGDSCMVENFGRLDVRSPDRLAGDLHFLDDTIVLTPEELSRAPAEVLGRSSHGTSYRATLDNGVFLTVKWLREGVAKPKKEFAKEAKKFANIRHPNVVGLRGYYWGPTQHEKLILSDYISPGSLASFLYGNILNS